MSSLDSGRVPLWFRTSIAIGSMLAVLVLVQTVAGYWYLSGSLVRQEAARSAERAARTVRAAIRYSDTRDATALGPLLEDLRAQGQDTIAWLAIVSRSGDRLSSSALGDGDIRELFSAQELQDVLDGGVPPVLMPGQTGLPVIVALVPCRCFVRAPRGEGARPAPESGGGATTAGPRSNPAARTLVAVALLPDGISASFGRLRRTSVINGAAAVALLFALGVIGRRFPAYLRGRQLESELSLARQVQRNLQPPPDRHPSSVVFAADCLPATHVGGDFYDVTEIGENRVAFVLGDVSGHGMPAALVMGLIHGALSTADWSRALETKMRSIPRLNQLLLEKTADERYATLFWCSYDAVVGQLSYINAGHVPPVLLRCSGALAGQLERLETGGPPVGLLPGAVYDNGVVDVAPGDLLVIVSDGIVEAEGEDEEPFGDERLLAAIRGAGGLPVDQVRDAILSRVRSHSIGANRDDQTLLVISLREPEAASEDKPLSLTA